VISLSIARKYARALLAIGLKDGNYEALGKDLEKVAALLRENKELRSILLSAIYPTVTRKGIAQKVCAPLALSKSTADFIQLLIDRERIDHFFEIAKSYESLSDAVAHRLRATLVTAMSLSPQLVTEIKNQLEATTQKQVILSVKEDPSLIGGVLTKIGNVIYDGSLRTQLLKARENLYKE
jgi:F-type H+-transporting ATPase subunit delta